MSLSQDRRLQHYYKDKLLAKNWTETMKTVSTKLEDLITQAGDRNGRKRDTFEQTRDLRIAASKLSNFGERLVENQRRKERKIRSLQEENSSLRNSVVILQTRLDQETYTSDGEPYRERVEFLEQQLMFRSSEIQNIVYDK